MSAAATKIQTSARGKVARGVARFQKEMKELKREAIKIGLVDEAASNRWDEAADECVDEGEHPGQ